MSISFFRSGFDPKTIHPVQIKNIPLLIRPFYEPGSSPSVISNKDSMDDKVPKIIVRDNQVSMNVSLPTNGYINNSSLNEIIKTFGEHKTHLNLMQLSATCFSACFDERANKLEPLVNALSSNFSVSFEKGFTLITIRHYNDELIEELTKGKKVYFEQKSPSTIQLLTKIK